MRIYSVVLYAARHSSKQEQLTYYITIELYDLQHQEYIRTSIFYLGVKDGSNDMLTYISYNLQA